MKIYEKSIKVLMDLLIWLDKKENKGQMSKDFEDGFYNGVKDSLRRIKCLSKKIKSIDYTTREGNG